MFCTKCGAQIPEGQTECTMCAQKEAYQAALTGENNRAMSLKSIVTIGLSALTLLFWFISMFRWMNINVMFADATVGVLDTITGFFKASSVYGAAAIAAILMVLAFLCLLVALVMNVLAIVTEVSNKKTVAADILSAAAGVATLILALLAMGLFGAITRGYVGCGIKIWVWLAGLLSILKGVIAMGFLDAFLDK